MSRWISLPLLALLLVGRADGLPDTGSRKGGAGTIAYRGADGNIWLADPVSGDSMPITKTGQDYTPAWSPDGSRIVYSARKGGQISLQTMKVDGSDVKEITRGSVDLFPRFRSDGRVIVFERLNQGTWTSRICVVNVDGTGLKELTDGADDASLPAFSRDGKWVVYVAKVGGVWKLHVMDSEGKKHRKLPVGGYEDRSPTFTPDGRRILYSTREAGGEWQLHVTDLRGRKSRPVARGDGSWHSPKFQPGGNHVTFMISPNERDWRAVESAGSICVMDLRKKKVRNIGKGFYPSWGPRRVRIGK